MLTRLTLDAGRIGLVSLSGSFPLALQSVTVVAGDVGIQATGEVTATDLTVDAGGDCVEAAQVDLEGAALSCGTDGLVTPRGSQSLADTVITPGGACASAASATWQGVACRGAAGDCPFDFEDASLTDVLVEGCRTERPARLSGGAATLDGLRFVGNTTAAGAGALALDDATVTAVQVGFEDNQGVTAGALAVLGTTTLDLQGGLFRGNTASAGPGAVLDEAGGSFACVIFQENAGEAGDVRLTDATTSVRNATFVGSSATATGSLHLDAAWATVTNSIVADARSGWGVFGDTALRTAYLTYNDVWANADGAWGGGMFSPTGSNGNQEVDPGFVAYSADGDWTNDDLSLASGSVLIDAGHPAWPDLDGSAGDLGAHGSACAGLLDYDGDGRSPVDGDCDDLDPAVSDTTPETCDGVDDDCDGLVDDDDPDLVADIFCPDTDGDGWGDGARAEAACTAPSGWVADCGDCDEGDPALHPGAAEHCDGVDEDCDGLVDDDPADGFPWYADQDHDGYGDPAAVLHTCEDAAPAGYVADTSDCDDSDPTRHDTALWHRDADGDGYGDPAVTLEQCLPPSGWVRDATDCADDDPDAWPGAPEVAGDGIDQDCDGEDPDLLVSELVAGELVITEIMLEPTRADPDLGTWIEVLNLTGRRLDPTGLVLDRGSAGPADLACDGVVEAGARLVVAVSPSASDNGGVRADCTLSAGGLALAMERLALVVGGLELDEVDWEDCADFPCTEGASLSLDPGATDAVLNDDGVHWCAATSTYGLGDRGTPGEPNDPCGADSGVPDTGLRDTGEPGGCGGKGCASGGGGRALGLLALLGLVSARRRRLVATSDRTV